MREKTGAEFFAAKVMKQNAEKMRSLLLEKKLLEFDFGVMRSADFVIFPLKRKPSEEEIRELEKKIKSFAINKMFFTQAQRQPKSLKEALLGKLSEKEFSELVSGFDALENIAIIEIPKAHQSLKQARKILFQKA